MAFEIDGGGPASGRRPVVARALSEDANARKGAAVLVVAFACAASGLVMGLCLAASPWPALSFVFGALLGGSGVWFMRDLLVSLRY